jgi:phosphonate transport system permease protein
VSSTGVDRIAALRRARPRSRFLRASLSALALGALGALWLVAADLADVVSARRVENLTRFLERDALPEPLRDGGGLSELCSWALGVLRSGGAEAALRTLAIAVVATGLASVLGGALALVGARDLAARDPFGPREGTTWRTVLARAARLLAVVARAIPEYVLAFLMLGVFGATAWPAVFALALHNAGILGRLGAEAVEDVERRPVRGLVEGGASRLGLLLAGILPLAAGRYLMYTLYRLESGLREATALGLLGIASLGAAVEEARARQRYDELLLLVLTAALLVALVEAVSRRVRRGLRARA